MGRRNELALALFVNKEENDEFGINIPELLA